MDDSAWNAFRESLTDPYLEALALIPRDVYEAALAEDLQHPVALLFTSRAMGNTRELPSIGQLTGEALFRIHEWLGAAGSQHRHWWKRTLGRLKGDDAAGTLAEIRALGSMLSTADSPTGGLQVQPVPTQSVRTPDFAIGPNHQVFVEVCCVRMSDLERDRHAELDQVEQELVAEAQAALDAQNQESPSMRATASASWLATNRDGSTTLRRHQLNATRFRQLDGSTCSFTLAMRLLQPQGPAKAGGDSHTIASVLASRKKDSKQIPDGKPGLLWMDLCDPEWGLPVTATMPAEVRWLGMTLATTRGIWHSFYGQKDKTLFMDRAAVAFECGTAVTKHVQKFDGRFREAGHRWSAAILRCTDGLVLFENPDPLVPLPMPVLRELVGLRGYAVGPSFHRFAEGDFDGLRRRLHDVERLLAFYAE